MINPDMRINLLTEEPIQMCGNKICFVNAVKNYFMSIDME